MRASSHTAESIASVCRARIVQLVAASGEPKVIVGSAVSVASDPGVLDPSGSGVAVGVRRGRLVAVVSGVGLGPVASVAVAVGGNGVSVATTVGVEAATVWLGVGDGSMGVGIGVGDSTNGVDVGVGGSTTGAIGTGVRVGTT